MLANRIHISVPDAMNDADRFSRIFSDDFPIYELDGALVVGSKIVGAALRAVDERISKAALWEPEWSAR